MGLKERGAITGIVQVTFERTKEGLTLPVFVRTQ